MSECRACVVHAEGRGMHVHLHERVLCVCMMDMLCVHADDMRRRLAWSLRDDDKHALRSVDIHVFVQSRLQSSFAMPPSLFQASCGD